MKLAGSYAGRVWRRKSTVLGAAMGATLLVLCLQYGSSRLVDPPSPPQPQQYDQQQQPASAAVAGAGAGPGAAAENSVHFVANHQQAAAATGYPGGGDTGFLNQDLLDNSGNNGGGGGNRLDDVNNLLQGGGGGGALDDQGGVYQAAASGGGNRNQVYVPGQRLMHFDLKGAPPRVSYLKRIMSLAKELGATGVLIEWEDMFPWAGRLAPLAAGNAYSKQDVQEIIDAAVNNGLEVIPLVQTFGHVEFALKHSEFSELREVPESPQALCPSLNASHDFVHQMIEQVMDMHKNIRYLHIGCDEVFQMGECVRCRTQPRDTLFLHHVTRVASFVRARWPAVTPIIWDDMLRHLPPISLEQYRIGELVEPMVWVYAEDVYRFVPSSVWEKYAAIFARVWAASAFKGAFGETQYVPNAKRHLENNMRWLQVMQAEAPKFSGGFQGIAITGWQRSEIYLLLCNINHTNLTILRRQLSYSSTKLINLLPNRLNYSIESGPKMGRQIDEWILTFSTDVYYSLHVVDSINQSIQSIKSNQNQNRLMHEKIYTEYNKKEIDNFVLHVSKRKLMDHQRLYHSVTSLVRGAKDALWEIFDAYTVAEWIEQRIYPMVQQLEAISRDAATLKQPRVWPRRPFPILSDLHRIGLQFSTDSSPG
ncbi:hypothetical protein LSTR_LSTR006745 [Laodelphax striatellus]|uniref:beta-N-acetylhexosaminidase n=1 Tax=Laodelphax striatellus TaxID=195883 RepID=A0A482XE28_LAOST|nr:hypothetical protein LSTR_LSTR006745 [Laodelphax striatellus]